MRAPQWRQQFEGRLRGLLRDPGQGFGLAAKEAHEHVEEHRAIDRLEQQVFHAHALGAFGDLFAPVGRDHHAQRLV